MGRKRPKVRKVIERLSMFGPGRVPQYIDEGQVFLFPSTAPADGYHVVVWFPYHYGRPEAWLCSCPSFRYSAEDDCKHVRQLKEELHELSDNALTRGAEPRKAKSDKVSS